MRVSSVNHCFVLFFLFLWLFPCIILYSTLQRPKVSFPLSFYSGTVYFSPSEPDNQTELTFGWTSISLLHHCTFPSTVLASGCSCHLVQDSGVKLEGCKWNYSVPLSSHGQALHSDASFALVHRLHSESSTLPVPRKQQHQISVYTGYV